VNRVEEFAVRPHAAQATRLVQARPPEHPARWVIVASWDRCAHLSPHAAPEPRRVDDADLRARLARNAALVEAAAPRLEGLLRALRGKSNVAYVTDADGIVLASRGDARELERLGLLAGYDRSEARLGTNGAGTCLVAGRPVLVAGREHFAAAFHDRACAAAPIRAAGRRIVGALDVAGAAGHARDDRMARVTEVAREIEAALTRA
jgi:transcriptional regulator of acetoin/glycerol metabolism